MGVIVRLREWPMFDKQSCGEAGLGKEPDLGSEDGRTLADGWYAWKRERVTHRTGGRIKLRIESGVSRALQSRGTGSAMLPEDGLNRASAATFSGP
jgi:hypothetical protein